MMIGSALFGKLVMIGMYNCLSAQAKGPFVTLEQNGLLLSL